MCACDPAAFVPRSRAAVVDVAGAGRREDRDRAPGASQDGLGGRPRSPPRTRDCGPRGCARRSSPGLPDPRRTSVGATGAAEGGGPLSGPEADCAWGREQQELLVRTARLLLSEQPCTIPPLVSRNFHVVGTVHELTRGLDSGALGAGGSRASRLALAVCLVPA